MSNSVRVGCRAVIMVVLAILTSAGTAHAFDFEQLVERLKLTERSEIAFMEQRKLDALTVTLESKGRFVFEPPNKLIKEVTEPQRETAIIQNERLVVTNAEGVEVASVDLTAQAGLAHIFRGILGLLSGEGQLLKEMFEVSLSGEADDWRLGLAPREQAGDSGDISLDRLLVTGGNTIRAIEIHETGGDSTYITLQPPPG